MAVGDRSGEGRRSRRRSLSRVPGRQQEYNPATARRLVVRGETIAGPVLVTKEGQHDVASGAASHPRRPDRSADPGSGCRRYVRPHRVSAGGPPVSRRAASSVPATPQTLQIAVTPDQPVAHAEPGCSRWMVADPAGPPVQRAGQPRGDRRGGVCVRADETPDPARFFYRREDSRVATMFSRNYYFTGFSGSERLQLTGRDDGRSRSRTSRATRKCSHRSAKTSRTRSTGLATSSPTRRARRRVHDRTTPMRSRHGG